MKNKNLQLIENCIATYNSGKKSLAINKLKSKFKKNPNNSDLAASIALLYQRSEKDSIAKDYYEKAIKIDSSNASYIFNYGVLLYGMRFFEQGIKNVKQAIKIEQNAFYLLTLAKFLYNSGFTNESKEYLNKSQLIDEKNNNKFFNEIIWNKAHAELRQGNLELGWKYFQARLDFDRASITHDSMKSKAIIDGKIPVWNGENLDNKSIIIHDEQGFGDTIQFARYVKLLEKKFKNIKIFFICKIELVNVFKNLGKNITVAHREGNETYTETLNTDYYIFLMSLPIYFEKNYKSIYSNFPYLYPRKQRKKFQFIRPDKINIAISWTGSNINPNDFNRSLSSVKLFEPIYSNPQINCISMQVGNSYVEIDDLIEIFDASGYINDFQDSLDIISKVDLVITIDTALAHLAGAANIPCWVLIPKICTDWRWGENLSVSPWYKSISIYKQKKEDDWQEPINEIYKDLKKKFRALT